MIIKDKEHQIREHLALISTEVYLLLRAADEEERIDRYNMVQEQINAILKVMNDENKPQYSCPDAMLQ
jgi:hypothetical protein